MQVTDKLTKALTEAKYLNADNVSRYRCIMRIFFENYEKLRYWLYQEDVYAQMIQDPFFADYKPEQCQQDLAMLVEWKNLNTIQDTRKVSSIEEFKNKKFRYQMSEYSVEIERLVLRLENLFIEGASLEPTLLERIRINVARFPQMADEETNKVYTWWTDLNNDFVRLNQNYQDYIRDLNSVKAEEMMHTKQFLVFEDRLVEYLRNFIKGLQRNVGVIEEDLRMLDVEVKQQAHRMSAMVFGIERPYHLKGDLVRETDSMNLGVYEEQPFSVMLKPRVRTYREKSSRSAIRESAEEKQKTRQRLMEQQKEDAKKLRNLERDGRIDFDGLPVIEAHVREILLNRRWVLKAEDKELYYRMRDAIGEVRKFASEKLGCQVTENALMVKMEKIPVVPETFMGILDFSSREEYAFFCILLMFLEDKDAQEQFILSQLTEYIAANMPGEPVDWTVYTSRRRLIKVLRYAVEQGILGITDGNQEQVAGYQETLLCVPTFL